MVSPKKRPKIFTRSISYKKEDPKTLQGQIMPPPPQKKMAKRFHKKHEYQQVPKDPIRTHGVPTRRTQTPNKDKNDQKTPQEGVIPSLKDPTLRQAAHLSLTKLLASIPQVPFSRTNT